MPPLLAKARKDLRAAGRTLVRTAFACRPRPIQGAHMPEAVIVATARSPIGRAVKGSLKDMRPDDLAATIVRAVLDKVPALDPHEIDDIMLGCAQPAGEQGFNLARAVGVPLG